VSRLSARPGFWAALALAQLVIVYVLGALSVWSPSTSYGAGRLLANPAAGLAQAAAALAILGMSMAVGRGPRLKLAAYSLAALVAAFALYQWVTFLGGVEVFLVLAAGLLAREHSQRA
jgi:hypothetical protein